MDKYPVYYKEKEYCVEFRTYSIVVYLVERPKNIWQILKNIWNTLTFDTITKLNSYYGNRPIIDGGNGCYWGEDEITFFEEPEKNDYYYVNLCKEAVKTAVYYYEIKNANEISKKKREENFKNWDGVI